MCERNGTNEMYFISQLLSNLIEKFYEIVLFFMLCQVMYLNCTQIIQNLYLLKAKRI